MNFGWMNSGQLSGLADDGVRDESRYDHDNGSLLRGYDCYAPAVTFEQCL